MTLFLIMMERAGLIILLAYAFVHIPFIKQTLKQPELKKHQYILLILFSLFAIISNFTGVEIQSDLSIIPQTLNHIADQSSVANTRVLTIGVSGLIGGPIVGIIVGLLSVFVRYLQGGLAPHIYVISSLLIGLCYGLIRMDSEKARKLVQDFSKVIRANLQRAKQNLIPLHDELEQVNAYLALEEARFPNMVAFNLDNQTNSDDNLMIPPFTLQVLIENSYKHAFKHINKNNQLKVTIARNNDRLHIIVQDNGIGIPKEKLITLGKKLKFQKKVLVQLLRISFVA